MMSEMCGYPHGGGYGKAAFGAVTVRDADYHGPVVNLAARATKTAAPGTVVVTSDLADQLDDQAWRKDPRDAFTLRGVPEPTPLLRLTNNDPTSTAPSHPDPHPSVDGSP